MGSCLGHCLLLKNFIILRYWKYRREPDFDEDEEDDNNEINPNTSSSINRDVKTNFEMITSFFNKWKTKKDSSLRLELLDDAWCSSDNESPSPLPLIIAQLKPKGGKSPRSTPGMSLELEWEHLPEMIQQRHAGGLIGITDDIESGTSASAWSRGSSRDSLEWDNQAEEMNTVDDETERLLQEIERLNCKVLEETLDWTR